MNLALEERERRAYIDDRTELAAALAGLADLYGALSKIECECDELQIELTTERLRIAELEEEKAHLVTELDDANELLRIA